MGGPIEEHAMAILHEIVERRIRMIGIDRTISHQRADDRVR